MSAHRVPVDSGKYEFVKPANDYRIKILRYGEEWVGLDELSPTNAIWALMAELDAARVVMAAVREACAVAVIRDGAIGAALRRHDALTGDRTPPSEWALPKDVEP